MRPATPHCTPECNRDLHQKTLVSEATYLTPVPQVTRGVLQRVAASLTVVRVAKLGCCFRYVIDTDPCDVMNCTVMTFCPRHQLK
mmetsp:Transcript_49143/g.80807  ORF Transcript_49143/g.80807 Transcript_49143/m.80807 type:complete len:85 (+) Transcript_49143:174-428(+)